MLLFLLFLFNVVDAIPLAKLHDNTVSFGGMSLVEMPNSDLVSRIMSSKDDNEALLRVLSDADPAKLQEVITLLKALLTTSQNELNELVTSSDNADTAYNAAVAAHNAALVAQQTDTGTLETTKNDAISAANTAFDQGVAALQAAVDAAKSVVDSTNSTKNTANGVLSADQARLNNEINTLTTVIALIEGLLGINTMSPTSSPQTPMPTPMPTPGPTASPALPNSGVYDFEGDLNGWTILSECATSRPSFGGSPQIAGQSYAPDNSGHHGSYLLRSQNPGYGNDWTKGILQSPQFTICPGQIIDFLLAGGAYSRDIDPNNVDCNSGATQLQLETLVNNVWAKKLTKVPNGVGVRLNRYSWTFEGNACATARIRAYDLNAGGWGHVTFDYVRINVP